MCATNTEISNQHKQKWTKVATECFSIKDKDYLIIIDYTSKYFEVSKLHNKESITVIKTKEIFSRFGIPLEVISDLMDQNLQPNSTWTSAKNGVLATTHRALNIHRVTDKWSMPFRRSKRHFRRQWKQTKTLIWHY